MKGLTPIPAQAEMISAYDWIQGPGKTGGIDIYLIALWTQWSRFDPRLAELLVQLLSARWREIPPALLNEGLKKQPWPAAFGVLGESTLFLIRSSGQSPATQFQHWLRCAMDGIPPANHEQFFIGQRSFAGELMRQDAERSLTVYRKWGFLGQELLINKAGASGRRTLLPPSARKAVLQSLISGRKRIQVADYIEALSGMIHRRQAERDLEACPRLRGVGRTRGRWFAVCRARKIASTAVGKD